jgi:hypothetical protein
MLIVNKKIAISRVKLLLNVLDLYPISNDVSNIIDLSLKKFEKLPTLNNK